VEDPNLVGHIEDESEYEDLTHRFPAGPQQFAPLLWFGEQRPEISGLPFLRVLSSVADREEYCGEWLKDNPKVHGAVHTAGQVFENSSENIEHTRPSSLLAATACRTFFADPIRVSLVCCHGQWPSKTT
jgi:hypothetical protein